MIGRTLVGIITVAYATAIGPTLFGNVRRAFIESRRNNFGLTLTAAYLCFAAMSGLLRKADLRSV